MEAFNRLEIAEATPTHVAFNDLALAEGGEVDRYDSRPVEIVQAEVPPAEPAAAQAEVPPAEPAAQAEPKKSAGASPFEDPEAVLKRFITSDSDALELSHKLSSEVRSQYHALATLFSLKHLSRGEGDNRILTIYKPWAIVSDHPSHRERVSSELIKESFPVLPALAPNVQEVVEARFQLNEAVVDDAPKRKAGKPRGSKKDSAASTTQAELPKPQYSLRSKNK